MKMSHLSEPCGDATNMSCSSLSQDSKSIATFRRIVQNLHFEFDTEKSSQSSSEYLTQSTEAVCESPPPSEIVVMGDTGKKKRAHQRQLLLLLLLKARNRKILPERLDHHRERR
jgi:hypothetical protein